MSKEFGQFGDCSEELLLGAIIREQIREYQCVKFSEVKNRYIKKYMVVRYEAAKDYLFSEWGLEAYLDSLGYNISMDYIRRLANEHRITDGRRKQ